MKRKNVIWIFGDQHRAQALSCNGDPNVSTPEIDRLSVEGQNFPNAVCGMPLCCPFRGSLLSGKYPHHSVPGHEYQMPPKDPTIATVFNENGYDTAYFGKWHLDGFHERDGRAAYHIVPPERRGGFKEWVGFENNNSQWDSWVHGGEGDTAFHYRLPGYETDCLTDLLIDYIDKKDSEETPFFAVLSVQPPHNPYIAPAEFMGRFNPQQLEMRPNVPHVDHIMKQARRGLAGAYAQIENLDWNVGRIRATLADAGLSDDTHIIFFSDHGDMHGSQGQFLKMTPYEESIRIPFIMGGCIPMSYDDEKCNDSNAVLNHVDIAPTTLGLCGIDAPVWMEGFDYSGVRLKSRPHTDIPDSAFIQSVIPTMHGNSVDQPWRGVVTVDGWKYVCFENQQWLLFNLNEDPYEQANLAFNVMFKDKREELNEKLQKWIYKTGDEFSLPKWV
jgi:arylsulfatase A-like enzyme